MASLYSLPSKHVRALAGDVRACFQEAAALLQAENMRRLAETTSKV